MAGAGEGDGSGLHASRDAADSTPAPAQADAEASVADTSPPENAVTQLLPTVSRTTSDGEPQIVRAVVRRAAAALPALGHDGGVQPVPSSARATVDRRRLAAAHAAGVDIDDDNPDSPDDGASPGSGDADHPGADDSAPLPAPASGETPETPDVRAHPPDPDEAGESGGADAIREPETVADPTDNAEMPKIPAPAPGQPDARIPRHRRDDHGSPAHDLAPALVGAASTADVALRQARTDEWMPVVRAGADAVPLEPLPVGASGGARSRQVARSGPAVLDADSWDAVQGDDSQSEAYHGRRRAHSPAARRGLVIGLVVLGLAAAMGIAYLLNRSSAPAGPFPMPEQRSKAQLAIAQSESGELASATASPSASSTPRPTSPATTSPTTPPAPPSTGAPLAAFTITLEAEAVPSGLRPNTQRDANPDCYPNGPDVVSRIGNWGQPGGPGTITFTVNTPDAGTFAMTVVYANTGATRQAEIVVNGETALSPWPTFPNTENPPTCVDARAPIPVTLRQGSNTIRIGNPNGRGPTIDEIVISRP